MSNPINLPSCVLCQVPEGAMIIGVVEYYGHDTLFIKEHCQAGIILSKHIPLPPGNYGTPLTYADAPDELRAVVWVELIEADIKEISGNWILIPKVGAIKQIPPMPEEFQDPQYFIDIIEKKKK